MLSDLRTQSLQPPRAVAAKGVTVTEHANAIGLTRKSARQRLDKLVNQGLATKAMVTEIVRSNRWGKACDIETTFLRYTLNPD